jgi:hypothetical protein
MTGRLVLHRTRPRLVDGGPRSDVQRRRLKRAVQQGQQDLVELSNLMEHTPRRGGIDRTLRTAAAVENRRRRDERKAATGVSS